MSPTRREALAQFTAPLALPRIGWPAPESDPQAGTIAQYQAGRLRGGYPAVEVATEASRVNCLASPLVDGRRGELP